MNGRKIRLAVSALCVSAACLVGIAGRESYRSLAYKDSGGVWTIGYGETKGVKMGQTTTPERALVKLGARVDQFAQSLKTCLGDVPLYQHEWDAYVDLAYNVGAGAVCQSSIPKKLKAGQYAEACKTILSYDKITVNGRRVSCNDPKNNCRGIIKDRQRVYQMCMGG